MLYLPTPAEFRRLTTEELRAQFLVTDLFVADAVVLRLVDLDRVVLGSAVPVRAPLRLDAPEALRAEYFAARRELGVLNIGGSGRVDVDGQAFTLAERDVLYIGRGAREISFASNDAGQPARFYIVSYPAHTTHPTALVRRDEADALHLGSAEEANQRTVRRYVHAGGARSAQLVMGVTTLAPGSVWNTMPAHTHTRRTEVYLYFDVRADGMIVHLVGEPSETRHLIARDGDVALSPGWSIHSGCGTSAYSFCWAMGGENQDYADMQPASTNSLR
jgi:4-deoxy-L-threo-5-hexosulose-uronate ketol-isomerase